MFGFQFPTLIIMVPGRLDLGHLLADSVFEFGLFGLDASVFRPDTGRRVDGDRGLDERVERDFLDGDVDRLLDTDTNDDRV